jgi:hypothetical protein
VLAHARRVHMGSVCGEFGVLWDGSAGQ